METNVHYTAVGLFVIALTGVIVFTIIWLSSGISNQVEDFYLVYMQESVSGMSIDAPVEFNGVHVGNVSNMEIMPKDPHLVKITLKIKHNTPITYGTIATMNVRGLTGVGYLALKDEGRDLRPLLPTEKNPYPLIKTAPSLFVRLDAALTKLNESFSKLSDSMQTLFDEENQYSIKQTLVNLREITGTLATDKLMPNLESLSHNLVEITGEMKKNPSILIRGKQEPPLGPGEE